VGIMQIRFYASESPASLLVILDAVEDALDQWRAVQVGGRHIYSTMEFHMPGRQRGRHGINFEASGGVSMQV